MAKTLHVVFKTHLDVGFTDFAAAVKQRYFDRYIPQALRIARDLREAGGPDRLVWTTGSWILYEYLEQADAAARKAAEDGIHAGDLRWHGLPFTTHSELMDPGLFRFGLGLSAELDARFGVTTISAKMTDVPGHTRGIIPLMAERGLRLLHIGVNAASSPPEVPELFRWREPVSGLEIMVLYAKDGYGGETHRSDLGHSLAIAHSGDNLGPPDLREVVWILGRYRSRWPDFEVKASTLDDFARELETIRENLPVIEEEIGDTWIHGTASDPWKTAGFRALLRLRTRWMAEARGASRERALHRFSRALLMVPEHTWGMDGKTHLADYRNFGRSKFEAARAVDIVFEPTPSRFSSADVFRAYGRPQSYRKIEASWKEQRAYLHQAIAELPDAAQKAQAEKLLRGCLPTRTVRKGVSLGSRLGDVHTLDHFQVRFSTVDGSIVSLRDSRSGREWSSRSHPLVVYRYQSLSSSDYARFLREYVVHLDDPAISAWARPDYGRLGLEERDSESAFFTPRIQDARRDGNRFVYRLQLPRRPRERYGAPRELELSYTFSSARPEIAVELCWFDKPASRLPEASWLSFSPAVGSAGRWQMDKLGCWVSPLEVIPGGNRAMHGVGSGVRLVDEGFELDIESHDAHLVSPGSPRVLRFDGTQPRPEGGMHFCLHANLFSTNFPLWYEDDGRFRFRLVFRRPPALWSSRRTKQ